MAATLVTNYSAVPGASVEKVVTVTLDAAYPAGGYVFTAASFGLTVLREVTFSGFTTLLGSKNQPSLIPTYNSDGVTLASVALHLAVNATGLEVATGTNMTTTSFWLTVGGN